MRRLFQGLLTGLVMCAFSVSAYEIDFEVDAEVGYRQDSLNWTISNNDILLSTLKWEDLKMVQYRLDLIGSICNTVYMRGYADYGHIYKGKNTDTDYETTFAPDGGYILKDSIWCKSKQDAGKGEVFDLSFALGYPYAFFDEQLRFVPLAGYSYHEQHLRLFNAEILIDTKDGMVGPVPNLHSNYRTQWQGPWVGFDVAYQWTCELKVFGSFEYHWAYYHADANWNLREEEIEKFEHSSHDAQGIISSLGVCYDFCDEWTAGLMANYQTWQARHGQEKIFWERRFAEATNKNRIGHQNLDVVNWHSYSVNAFVGYYF